MTSFFHLLSETPHIDSNRLALSMRRGLREDRWTYRELWRGVNGVAQHLIQNLSFEKGDRIILFASNDPRTVLAQLGVLRAGLVSVPLDATATDRFIEDVGHQT
ncbi:MAG: acyl--CoA ligase [bacterium]|nr:acyl--CoA ligase [bacterium]